MATQNFAQDLAGRLPDWLQPLFRPGAQALDQIGNQTYQNSFQPWEQAGKGVMDRIGGAANQIGDAAAGETLPNGGGWTPEQIQHFQEQATTAGLDPTLIDEIVSGRTNLSYAEALANLEPRQLAQQQIGELDKFTGEQLPYFDQAINRTAGITGQMDASGNVAPRDPNKMLTDSVYGNIYSAGKAKYDQLADLGKRQSAEQEASSTGGAITGRGLQTNQLYDVARTQGLAGLTSGILGQANEDYNSAVSGKRGFQETANSTKRGLQSGLPVAGNVLDTFTGRTLTNQGLSNQAIGNIMGYGNQMFSNVLAPFQIGSQAIGTSKLATNPGQVLSFLG